MDLDVSVSKLKLLKQSHLRQQYSLEDKLIRIYPAEIKSYEDFLKKSIVSKKSGIVVYEFPKFSIIECRDKRQIMLAKEEELDLNLCNND